MLNLKSVRKDYVTASETVHALKGVSISFRKTEFVSILGPSGCGKTTLLNIIGGLDHYTDGDLVIGGRSTKEYGDRDWDVYRNHRVGFIFQSYNLIPHQTILGNVELALTIAGISKEERIERAKVALDRVGLKGQYYKKPNQLSGGQCQRVAIARALVNNPEILLADEPTGALDTVTSVQIMDLIKEISKERLVVMVTHNPELAEEYSTRIVRLLDGEVIEDTNPMTEEEIEAELNAEAAERQRDEEVLSAMSEEEKKKEIKARKKRREKAKMSFLTAFKLSAKNLWSKKGRTAMVGFAGSIGIIGIAMVLAFSAGIKGYVASMQDDMLSGNPITITETTYDLNAMSDMMDNAQKVEIIKQPNRVYINSLVEYITEMSNTRDSMIIENDLTEDYINFVKAMPKEYYAAINFGYGIDINANLFTNFTNASGTENLSAQRITDHYTAILNETSFKEYASYISLLTPTITQAPNDRDYVLSQYDILAGEYADGLTASGKYPIMLVLDRDDELSDLLLARYGFYTEEEFLSIIDKANAEGDEFIPEVYRDSFDYNELIGKSFTYYPTDSVFKTEINTSYGFPVTMPAYISNSADVSEDAKRVELEIVGIISPKDGVNYGCISSGIYYTEELTDYILESNKDSEFMSYLLDDANSAMLSKMYYRIPYDFKYVYDNGDGNLEPKDGNGMVGPASSMEDMIGSMMGGNMGGGASVDMTDMRDKLIRTLGGNSIANSVTIYPLSFDDKDLVTDYLTQWNEDKDIIVGDKVISYTARTDVKYTDTLDLIISIINTMIDVISYALIAFTSISLVVSTVMIGIITYVSVVERIKEIGVIRSLGGRKKDVSHLFNAETFIIGSLAGIFGIGVTYGISIIVNAILKPLINYPNIAALPIGQALLLIALSIGLTSISGLIPASSAAKKDPVVALRTE